MTRARTGYLGRVSVGQRIVLGSTGVVVGLLGVACAYLTLSQRGRRFARDSLSELRVGGGSLGDPAGLAVCAMLFLIMGVGLIAYALAGD